MYLCMYVCMYVCMNMLLILILMFYSFTCIYRLFAFLKVVVIGISGDEIICVMYVCMYVCMYTVGISAVQGHTSCRFDTLLHKSCMCMGDKL